MAHTKAEFKVLPCNCPHTFQDKTYSKGMRAHNPCKAGASGVAYRCTVCAKVKS
jgi:hypothetical protein